MWLWPGTRYATPSDKGGKRSRWCLATVSPRSKSTWRSSTRVMIVGNTYEIVKDNYICVVMKFYIDRSPTVVSNLHPKFRFQVPIHNCCFLRFVSFVYEGKTGVSLSSIKQLY